MAWRARRSPSAFAHRLELEAPPVEIKQAFALWDEVQADTEAEIRVLQWETGLEDPLPRVAPRYAPVVLMGMRCDPEAVPSMTTPGPEPAQGSALEAVSLAAARLHPELGPSYLEQMRWYYQGMSLRGATTLAVWEGERVLSALTLVPSPDGSQTRFQELWTARTHRRRGIATSLIARALARCREPSWPASGPCYLVTEEGSVAHGIYQRAGFSPISRVVLLSTERQQKQNVS